MVTSSAGAGLTIRARRAVLWFACLAVCAGDRPLQAQPAPPARIVSTSPNITETLFALGLGDRVVGVSKFCRFPPAVAALPKVGTFLRPDAEIIARLRPDLVFVHTGPNAIVAQLDALGIRTTTIAPGSLAAVFSTIRDIGAAAGVPARAERLVGDITSRLERVTIAVAGRPRRTVLIIVGRRTGTLTDMVAVGRGSYLSDIAAFAGGANVLATATQYPRISMETVISLAPDILIDVGEMGESPDDSALRRRITEGLWQRQDLVTAVRAGAVHVTTDDAFVVPGPRMIDVAELMATWFHGVRFP
ncbi:MAG: ABC transporter substrate-binding protein [Acidobacteria bacterium]|nr:ABC transporter substrate-binding protein [Acidobacteriota bacterium]